MLDTKTENIQWLQLPTVVTASLDGIILRAKKSVHPCSIQQKQRVHSVIRQDLKVDELLAFLN